MPNVAVLFRIRADRRKGSSRCFAFALVVVFLDERACCWTVIGWTPSTMLFIFFDRTSLWVHHVHTDE